jgi:hypothetical protein
MISYKQARRIALEELNSSSKGYRIALYEPGVSFEYGWIFYYDQEGVFHPRLSEINSKIKRCLEEGKSEEESRLLLSEKEQKIHSNSLGLVGQLPLFIDRETSKALFIKGTVETIKQTIRDIKNTGKAKI